MRSDARLRHRNAVVAALLLAGMAASGAVRAQDAGFRASIADVLVVPGEQRFEAYRWAQEPRIVALYFGADWCAPCHAFVPQLKQVHAALRAAGADTEVVFVSLDTSESDMRRYMRLQAMPWPAIDYRRLKALPAIRALGGPAPPNLVLLGDDGSVIASGWHDRRFTGLQPVLAAWIAAVSATDASSPTSPTSPTEHPQ